MNGAMLFWPYRRRRVGAEFFLFSVRKRHLNGIMLRYCEYLIDCSIINICLLTKKYVVLEISVYSRGISTVSGFAQYTKLC